MNKRQAYYILDPQTDTKQEGDEYWNETSGVWEPVYVGGPFKPLVYRRPVPDAVTLDDGWIPWSGGECPVAAGDAIVWRLRDGFQSTRPTNSMTNGEFWVWRGDNTDIIAYKVIEPAPKQPLEFTDVPPGSVFRCVVGEERPHYYTPTGVFQDEVHFYVGGKQHIYFYNTLVEAKWQIKRPGEDWKPCCK